MDDLKDACTEAAGGENDVKDFEIGVFCGKYKTEIPDGYLERLSHRLQEGSKRKNAFTEDEENAAGARKMMLVANSGPVNVADTRKVADKETRNPEHQEDVRYVLCVIHMHRINTRLLTVLQHLQLFKQRLRTGMGLDESSQEGIFLDRVP